MTHLRQLMLDELQRRNYAQNSVRAYIHGLEDFAKYFHRSPARLGPEHIREYQVHLFRDCKLSPGTIGGRTAALRFLFVKTLRRPYLPDHIPFPKRPSLPQTVRSYVPRLSRNIWRALTRRTPGPGWSRRRPSCRRRGVNYGDDFCRGMLRASE